MLTILKIIMTKLRILSVTLCSTILLNLVTHYVYLLSVSASTLVSWVCLSVSLSVRALQLTIQQQSPPNFVHRQTVYPWGTD